MLTAIIFISLQILRGVEVLTVIRFVEIILYIFVYTSFWYHIIILLIVLEFIILKNFLLTVLLISITNVESVFIFFFRALAVREARLGISLLTVLARAHGNDYLRIELVYLKWQINALVLRTSYKENFL